MVPVKCEDLWGRYISFERASCWRTAGADDEKSLWIFVTPALVKQIHCWCISIYTGGGKIMETLRNCEIFSICIGYIERTEHSADNTECPSSFVYILQCLCKCISDYRQRKNYLLIYIYSTTIIYYYMFRPECIILRCCRSLTFIY
jgi:hypothetical protein